ncbi:hypothetical protein C8255_02710 [filamentous cyanobacterium CCP3]|nr:hypothetical protein C8255_02710 [filamentous cyanobacterium CCP3]
MLRKLFAPVLYTLLCTLLSLILVASPASAKPFPFSLPLFENVDLTADQKALVDDLRSKYVPQIESILFPEQRKQFEQSIQDGYSLRKAFKAMALTTEQKTELAATLKTVPKGNLFAALTPEQKKEVFMNKKDMFIPTPDEIAERIKVGMESKAALDPDAPGAEISLTPEEISEKVKLGFEKKKEFMPSLEEIKEKIAAKIEAIGE